MRNEVTTLKSRIELFFSVLTLMPNQAKFKFFDKHISQNEECPNSSESDSDIEESKKDSDLEELESKKDSVVVSPFTLSDIFPNMFVFQDTHED